MSKYSTKSTKPKWTMVNFYYILDTIRSNASTLYAIKHNISPSKVNSFSNGWDLVVSLVKPQIMARPTNGLSTNTLSKMSVIVGKEFVATKTNAVEEAQDGCDFPRYGETRQRCDICLFNITGPQYKANKSSLGKTKSRCQKCGKPVCENHSKIICRKHL